MAKKKQINKETGLFFKKARTEQKLTYEELAEMTGISNRYLKEIENRGNVPNFEKIKQLVCALNVSPAPLFYKDNHTDNLDYKRLQVYLEFIKFFLKTYTIYLTNPKSLLIPNHQNSQRVESFYLQQPHTVLPIFSVEFLC